MLDIQSRELEYPLVLFQSRKINTDFHSVSVAKPNFFIRIFFAYIGPTVIIIQMSGTISKDGNS